MDKYKHLPKKEHNLAYIYILHANKYCNFYFINIKVSLWCVFLFYYILIFTITFSYGGATLKNKNKSKITRLWLYNKKY